MQPTDTTAIQRLISRARVRIRGQWAIEGATTATVLAAALALVSVFTMRTELVSPTTGVLLLVLAGLAIVAGALISAFRPLDDETVARRIDRASNLSDRLSTAIAFRRTLASGKPVETEDGVSEDETIALMHAAINDGVRAVPRANLKAATPFRAPRDGKVALGFLAVSALAAGLAIPRTEYLPVLYRAEPGFATPGEEVYLVGENLLSGLPAPRAASLPAGKVLGAPGAPQIAGKLETGYVPEGASVKLGPVDGGLVVPVLDWTKTSIRIRIPANAPFGETILSAHIKGRLVGPVAFTVVRKDDARFHKEGAVMFDEDERAFIESVIAELEMIALRDKVPELADFAKKLRQMMKDAEEGKITKEQLLAELAKAEEMLNADKEPAPEEIAKQMAELGKELAKEPVTKELGKALEQNDLEKAKEELEKLANKLNDKALEEAKKELEEKLKDQNLSEQEKQDLQKKLDALKNEKPLTEQQKEQLQKQLEQAAKKMEQQQKAQEQKAQQQQEQVKEEMRRLQKQKDEAKTEKEKLEAERRLQKKQDELKQLQKQEDEKNKSAQRDAIKRLQKDVEKAAEQLQKPKSKEESEQEKDQRERQASQKIKDAARETGRVDQDKRKQATQKKISSQMDDLREAMQRAKQKGNKGPQDPFNKKGKNQDFAQRARGQKGQGQAWKPGQGQGQGQQPGGQGQNPGGQKWGTGHDPNLTGDATGKSGNTKDVDLQGRQGKEGGGTRETILAAAQKGFASKKYREVYQNYKKQNEEVMRNEKLPSSYKYFVKRYFAKIHPSADNSDGGTATELEAPTPNKGK